MFFAEGEEKEFPDDIKKEIYNLKLKDRKIYELNKKNKDVNLRVINFVIDSLNLFLRRKEELNEKQKSLMTEAIGNIPITFFILDKLNVKKDVKETINPLVDIVDAHANLHIDREKLILEILEKLQRLKEKYKKI